MNADKKIGQVFKIYLACLPTITILIAAFWPPGAVLLIMVVLLSLGFVPLLYY